ncbi:hypothetical protein FQZ97_1119510 [compost metagenome]
MARAISALRQASAWAWICWISGTMPLAGLRCSIQCMKLSTPASMMASACATAAWRLSLPVCTTVARSSTV